MYIFQPERIILREQIKRYAHYLHGVVLDVGAGTGDRYGAFITCKKFLRMDVVAGEGIDLVGRAEAIPMDNESVDGVLCTQVFEHLRFPEESAKEISRVLRSGGFLLITAPQVNELHEEPNDFFRYTKFGLIALFERAGFKTITYDQRGGFFTVIAQTKIRYLIDRFELYDRPIIGRLLGKICLAYGKVMMSLDRFDNTAANRKHSLGWCFVFQKEF